MQSRVPLSIVLSAPGQRHAIPHATLTLPADGAFFSYLASDDTRLPNHPYLNGRGVDPTEYDTYVGEDVWSRPGNTVDSSDSDSDAEEEGEGGEKRVRHADLVFDDVVEWLVQLLDEEEWTRDGVVVCGRYVVADDATWAVPSRSPTVYTAREAFMVMRCSCKFLHDIHAQRRTSGGGVGEITIAKAMAGSAAKEMRAFVPYRLTRSTERREDGGGWCLSEPIWGYAGVCQRHTDVCIPSLMAWTEAEHNEHFSLVMERLRKSQLLERACERDPRFLLTAAERWLKSAPREGGEGHTSASPPPHGFYLFLAVDLLFESASLPIPLLSAKARLFPAREPEPPSFVGLPSAPFLVEPRDGHDGECQGTGNAITSAGNCTGEEAVDESDDDEERGSDATSFFRLFRNELNWNHYVEEMEDRWESAAHDAVTLHCRSTGRDASNAGPSEEAIIPPSVLSDVKVAQYCVVASEAADLVACSDTLTKRGLPLELLHPELLQGDQQGIDFLKGLSERLLHEAQS